MSAMNEFARVMFDGETTAVYCEACADGAEVMAAETIEWFPVEELMEAEACDRCAWTLASREAVATAVDYYFRWRDEMSTSLFDKVVR